MQQPRDSALGFLKKFFSNVFDESMLASTGGEPTRSAGPTASPSAGPSSAPTRPAGGFAQLSEQELESHLRVSKYGNFELSDAVRPAYNLEVVPSAGFRHDMYRDEENRAEVPVLMAAVSRERMMDTFMSLIEQLGDVVDVVLETSHGQGSNGHTDLYREYI